MLIEMWGFKVSLNTRHSDRQNTQDVHGAGGTHTRHQESPQTPHCVATLGVSFQKQIPGQHKPGCTQSQLQNLSLVGSWLPSSAGAQEIQDAAANLN